MGTTKNAILKTILSVAAVFLSVMPLGHAQTWPFDPPTEISKVVVPVYEKLNPEPVAVFRAERFIGDYQTRGFFRIGALPLTVAEDLTIELKDAFRVSTALNVLGARFAPDGTSGRGIEGRNFSLAFSGQKQGTLRARSVRLERPAEWTMEDGVVNMPNSAPVYFQRGTLTVQGQQTGMLTCQTTNGVFQVHVLALNAN